MNTQALKTNIALLAPKKITPRHPVQRCIGKQAMPEVFDNARQRIELDEAFDMPRQMCRAVEHRRQKKDAVHGQSDDWAGVSDIPANSRQHQAQAQHQKWQRQQNKGDIQHRC